MPIKFFLRGATGQLYAVTGPFRIGREPECQIQIDNNLISRIHASVWLDHDHLLLRDERSRNGTQLNGQPLAPGEAQYLHHDDEVRVGDTVLTVVSDPPYPRPRQRAGLPGLEDEPPPTFKVEKSSAAPAPPPPAAAAVAPPAGQRPAAATAEAPMPYVPPPYAPPPAAAPPAAPPRSNTLLLAIGGCLLLVVIAACCVLGFALVARFGPGLKVPVTPSAAFISLGVWEYGRVGERGTAHEQASSGNEVKIVQRADDDIDCPLHNFHRIYL